MNANDFDGIENTSFFLLQDCSQIQWRRQKKIGSVPKIPKHTSGDFSLRSTGNHPREFSCTICTRQMEKSTSGQRKMTIARTNCPNQNGQPKKGSNSGSFIGLCGTICNFDNAVEDVVKF